MRGLNLIIKLDMGSFKHIITNVLVPCQVRLYNEIRMNTSFHMAIILIVIFKYIYKFVIFK